MAWWEGFDFFNRDVRRLLAIHVQTLREMTRQLNIFHVCTAASDRSDRSRDRSIEPIDSIDSIIFRSFEIFSNFRWRRRDSNGPKIIKILAILAKIGDEQIRTKKMEGKAQGQGTAAAEARHG